MALDSLQKLNSEIIICRKCPRLVSWREEVARVKRKAYRDQEYWGKPVPGFGDPKARVLVVGLAPGAHGSNRTGRNFTGDASGGFLYPALYRAGFANQALAESRSDHNIDASQCATVTFDLACVSACADFKSQGLGFAYQREAEANRAAWPVKVSEEAISARVDLLACIGGKLSSR